MPVLLLLFVGGCRLFTSLDGYVGTEVEAGAQPHDGGNADADGAADALAHDAGDPDAQGVDVDADAADTGDGACTPTVYGPVSATLAEEVGTGLAWESPGAAAVPDATYASVLLVQNSASKILRITGFPLSVPPGAAITGVEMIVTRRCVDGVDIDDVVKLASEGAFVGDNRAKPERWDQVWTDVSYGGPDDLWGAVLTPEAVNDPTFGIALSTRYDTGSVLDDTAQVDGVRVKVYTCE
ncbi:MAG: hypothetical protein ACOC1F_08695 [Myxococcota bacterium]